MQKPERKRVLLIMEFEKAPGKRNRDIKEMEVYLPDGRGAETVIKAYAKQAGKKLIGYQAFVLKEEKKNGAVSKKTD